MKWAVYWQPDDIEIEFFKTRDEALARLEEIKQANLRAWDDNPEENIPYWDITLLQVKGDIIQTQDGLKTLLYEVTP